MFIQAFLKSIDLGQSWINIDLPTYLGLQGQTDTMKCFLKSRQGKYLSHCRLSFMLMILLTSKINHTLLVFLISSLHVHGMSFLLTQSSSCSPHLQKVFIESKRRITDCLKNYLHSYSMWLSFVSRGSSELVSQTNLFKIWLEVCKKNSSNLCPLNLSRHDGGTLGFLSYCHHGYGDCSQPWGIACSNLPLSSVWQPEATLLSKSPGSRNFIIRLVCVGKETGWCVCGCVPCISLDKHVFLCLKF